MLCRDDSEAYLKGFGSSKQKVEQIGWFSLFPISYFCRLISSRSPLPSLVNRGVWRTVQGPAIIDF